ncbi:MAG: hypothetical protein QM731_17015 [Chitinophagaceae bacterium]
MAIYNKDLKIFEGTIGNITFCKYGDKLVARSKSNLTAKRFRKDKAFAGSRAHAAEFGKASRAAKLLRWTLAPLSDIVPLGMISGKMSSAFDKVIKSDTFHAKGTRELTAGDLSLLKGFELNQQCSLYEVLPLIPVTAVDTSSGKASVTIPSFVPGKTIKAPKGATHFRILSCVSILQLHKNNAQMDHQQTDLLPLNKKATGVIELSHAISNPDGEVMTLITGIAFYKQSAAGVVVAMKEGAMCLTAAERLTLNAERKKLNAERSTRNAEESKRMRNKKLKIRNEEGKDRRLKQVRNKEYEVRKAKISNVKFRISNFEGKYKELEV